MHFFTSIYRYRHNISQLAQYEQTLSTNLLSEDERDHILSLITDVRLAPLSATKDQLKKLPKTVVLTCGTDYLTDDGVSISSNYIDTIEK